LGGGEVTLRDTGQKPRGEAANIEELEGGRGPLLGMAAKGKKQEGKFRTRREF